MQVTKTFNAIREISLTSSWEAVKRSKDKLLTVV